MKNSLEGLVQQLGEAKAWADRIIDPVLVALGMNGTLYLLAAEAYSHIPERNVEAQAGVGLGATAAALLLNYYVLPPLVRCLNASTQRAGEEGRGLSFPGWLKTASLTMLASICLNGTFRSLETGGKVRPSAYFLHREEPIQAAPEKIYTTIDYTNSQLQDMMSRGVFEEGFLERLEQMCRRLDMHAMALLSILHHETAGTFNPRIRNKYGAVGIIQFIPPTARALGTSDRELRGMTQLEQLEYVEKYMRSRQGEGTDLSNPSALATAVFYPRANGDAQYVIARRGSKTYRLNRTVDRNRDGVLHAGEYTHMALRWGYLGGR